MGVDIYALKRGTQDVRIGSHVFPCGVIGRLWKITETDLAADRVDTLDALDDLQRTREFVTPRAVVVDDYSEFGEQSEIRASRVLGWPAGKLKTQDYDWDHLPEIGWAVHLPDGDMVLHERTSDTLTPMSEARAKELGILDPNGELAEHCVPTIAKCQAVESMGATYYSAECLLQDGREAKILGESESGALPPATWFAGRTVEAAGKFRLPDEIVSRH